MIDKDDKTLSVVTLSVVTLSVVTLSVVTLSVVTLSVVTLSVVTLSVVRQCGLLKVARSSLYYHPSRNNNDDLTLMALIDRQFLEMPCDGSRKMTAWLRLQGHAVNRKRVRRLMREMDLTPIYQKPRTSQPHPDHQIYPYLLRGLAITRPNQVWAADITYIPMARGFLYVVAIMDCYSRTVRSWRLSNTLEAEFCVTALEDALAQYGRPEIFNTDQGCQFTSTAFTGLLKAQDVRRPHQYGWPGSLPR